MKTVFMILISFLLVTSVVFGDEPAPGFFDQVDVFLAKYVANGLVDYEALKADRTHLDKVVKRVETFDLKASKVPLTDKAFWLNAYNILVIKSVVDAYPIDSPLDVDGFFKTVKHTAAGQSLTLDEIENEKVRAKFGDPRIHFALVCAAVGCPKIIAKAYRPEVVEKMLEKRAAETVNNEFYVKADKDKKTVFVSQIFEWFKSDFEADDSTVMTFLNRYLSKNQIPAEYMIAYIPYDWKLNAIVE